jgi:hypothetical protein
VTTPAPRQEPLASVASAHAAGSSVPATGALRWPGPADGAPPQPSWRTLALVAAITGALTLLLAVCTTRVGLQKDDAGQYYQMAESPAFLARLPYTFRVFSPGLAGLWPGDPITGFTLVTLLALPLAATALYAYQRSIGLGHGAALAGALLFTVSGGAIRMLTTPVYVDAVTYLTEAAAFWLLARRQFWPFVAVVSVGVLNRETALLLVAPYLLVAPPWRPPTAWTRTLLLLAIPSGIFALVVILKLAAGGVLSGAVPLATLAPFARTFRQDIPSLPELFDVYSTLGVLWLLALRHLPGPTSVQRLALVYGALVILQLTVSRGDEGRNLSHLFPLVIPLAMLEVQRLLRPAPASQPGRADLSAGVARARRIDAAHASAGRQGIVLAGLLVAACAASMVHARWTILEPAALRYGLVAGGTVLALAIAWGRPLLLRQARR